MSALAGARAAISFLTPAGGEWAPSPAAVPWFPVVGLLTGAVVGAVWWVTATWWPAPVSAALTVLADLGVTGMLHFDGLCDSADGLLAPMDRVRRLSVMSAPDVGAFGVAVGGALLILRTVCLGAMHPSPLLLAGAWGLARAAMAATLVTVPYARSSGLATAFRRPGHRRNGLAWLVPGALVAGAACLATGPGRGAAVVVAMAAATAGVVWLSVRRLGGFTGDVLGAAGIVGETAALVVASARW